MGLTRMVFPGKFLFLTTTWPDTLTFDPLWRPRSTCHLLRNVYCTMSTARCLLRGVYCAVSTALLLPLDFKF